MNVRIAAVIEIPPFFYTVTFIFSKNSKKPVHLFTNITPLRMPYNYYIIKLSNKEKKKEKRSCYDTYD